MEGAGSVHTFAMLLGGERIRIELAGAGLSASVTRAFGHAATGDAGAPDLTIKVWDTAGTGVAMPSPVWGPYDYGPKGEISGFNNERFGTVYQIDPGSLSMIDRTRGVGLFWIKKASDYPEWMRAAPLRTILAWWFGRATRQFVHGAGVGAAGKGVLLAGRGGSGKSTTSLLCLEGGFDFVGDDYVLVDVEPRPVMHGIYGSAKLDDTALNTYLPGFRQQVTSRIVGSGPDKGVVYLERGSYGLVRSLSLDSIVVLKRGKSREASLRPASRAAALSALAPTTLFQLSGAGSSAFSAMTQLIRRVPVFELELGRGGNSGPRLLGGLLEGL